MTSTNIYCDTLSSHRLKNQRPTIGNTIITKAKKRIIAAPSLYQNQSSTSPTAISTITVNTNSAKVSVIIVPPTVIPTALSFVIPSLLIIG